MNNILREVAATESKNKSGILDIGGGKNNIFILVIAIIILCGCSGGSNFISNCCNPIPVAVPVPRRGRRRRRIARGGIGLGVGAGGSLIFLIIVAVLLAGNNQGRNINTNVINVDTDGREGEDLVEL